MPSQTTHTAQDTAATTSTRIVVIGSGVGGLAMGRQLKLDGEEDFLILERAHDIGGTWRDNSYPGCACDVPSHLYSFSFRLNPNWSRVHAPQPEILEYVKAMARDAGLYEHFVFGADVEMCTWDEESGLWHIETSKGAFEASVLISATGHLADPRYPDIEGFEDFTGTIMHSARWDHSIDLTGKRVGVVGTGASAVQIIPEVAKVASQLTVFQRSAAWVRPRNDREYTVAEKRMFARTPAAMERVRADMYWNAEQLFLEKKMVDRFLDSAEELAIRHLNSQVSDPGLRQKLTPDYRFGCKRTLRTNDYFPTFNLPHVYLDTSGLARMTPSSVVTKDGREHELDVLIFATGFEAADLPISHRITGRGGVLLADHWSNGPTALASIASHGFPNLFIINGPNASVLASIIFISECQVSYISGALRWMADEGVARLEPTQDAEDAYGREMDRRSQGTVWLEGGCHSWYVDEATGRLTAIWPDFGRQYLIENGQFSPEGYEVAPLSDREMVSV